MIEILKFYGQIRSVEKAGDSVRACLEIANGCWKRETITTTVTGIVPLETRGNQHQGREHFER